MESNKLAYMAGLFDGEGCIHIARIHTQKRSLTFQLNCKVSMNNSSVLETYREYFGGSVRNEKQDEKHNKSGSLHSWAIFGSKAVVFLTALMPYLRIKKGQAKLAIEFQSAKRQGAENGRWGNQSKSKDKLAVEETQYLLMRTLKKEVLNV